MLASQVGTGGRSQRQRAPIKARLCARSTCPRDSRSHPESPEPHGDPCGTASAHRRAYGSSSCPLIPKSRRECGQTPIDKFGRNGNDQAAINAAAKKGADWHVRHETTCDRILDCTVDLVDRASNRESLSSQDRSAKSSTPAGRNDLRGPPTSHDREATAERRRRAYGGQELTCTRGNRPGSAGPPRLAVRNQRGLPLSPRRTRNGRRSVRNRVGGCRGGPGRETGLQSRDRKERMRIAPEACRLRRLHTGRTGLAELRYRRSSETRSRELVPKLPVVEYLTVEYYRRPCHWP